MQNLSTFITNLFFSVPEVSRYLIVFVTSFIEGMPVIGAVLPGGTIALLIGSLSAKEFVSPILAVFIIALGTFSGDMLGFAIGRRYRESSWLKKIIFYNQVLLKWNLIEKLMTMQMKKRNNK